MAPARILMCWQLALAASCGRIHFAELGDGQQAVHVCQSFGAFGPPVAVAGVNTTLDDWGPWLSEDRLELYFSRGMGSMTVDDLYHATRTSPGLPFGSAVPLAVNNGDFDEDPYVSPDGLTLYWDSAYQLARATRPDRLSDFGSAAFANDLDVAGFPSMAPSLTPDQLTIVFDSDRGMGNHDIYIAKRDSVDHGFGAAGVIPALAGGGDDDAPTLDATGTVLFYVTARFTGFYQQIGISTDLGNGFGAPAPFDPVVPGTYNDVDPYLTQDGLTLVFASDRPGGAGAHDIYEIDRPCLDQ